MPAGDTTHRPVPADDEWDYGGYRYGLEPLFLPSPGEAARARRAPLTLAGTTDQRRAEPATPAFAAVRPSNAPDLEVMDDIFWFRWITGHQVTFLLWHLMARALPSGPSVDDEAAIAQLTCLTEGCNAMLLYTGSCTPEAYDRFIRPAMYRQHHGFSGAWAPDYAPVRRLFGVRPPTWVAAPGAKQLHDALRVNHAVHGAVAARLAPGSQSLLQRFAPAMRAQERSVYGVMFDDFFLTTRRDVSDEHVHAQLERRLHAVLFDIHRNRFHPAGPTTAPAQHGVPVRECEERFPTIVARLMPLPRVTV